MPTTSVASSEGIERGILLGGRVKEYSVTRLLVISQYFQARLPAMHRSSSHDSPMLVRRRISKGTAYHEQDNPVSCSFQNGGSTSIISKYMILAKLYRRKVGASLPRDILSAILSSAMWRMRGKPLQWGTTAEGSSGGPGHSRKRLRNRRFVRIMVS